MSLRELTTDDARAVQRIYSSASVLHLPRAAMEGTEAQRFVERAVRCARETPRTHHVLGIDMNGDLLGIIKLNRTSTNGKLSYILRDDAWGCGVATAAVTELLVLAFGVLGLPVVTAKHHADNAASGRVLVKAGFSRTETTGGFVHYAAEPGSADRPRLGLSRCSTVVPAGMRTIPIPTKGRQ
ncbi:hypothetical protein GCM10018790_18530 [Kitasatospora xanthocidica]|uniref:GNAT family N-acetyltransferase n=1 Tax=Kitasatospora xanthocidica TaxID=83382 RepID=UPI0016746AC4|nr:GNAT family N-acetyltransferase [Kitasatospora xanthocidica]GHF41196.1 hypothetical protein GCM10018790_18530 [Kitasatospora xanthocidica]